MGNYGVLICIFAVLALFLMVLIEGCRVPVDDPATHLELTMIHEVMILDNSGFDLAMLTYAASMKMLLISSLIVKIIIPDGTPYYPIYLFSGNPFDINNYRYYRIFNGKNQDVSCF